MPSDDISDNNGFTIIQAVSITEPAALWYYAEH